MTDTQREDLTYETLIAAIAAIDIDMRDVVERFVGHPETVDQFLTLARKAGVAMEQSATFPVAGIPFVRDDTRRRGFIEGRNHRDELIRVFALIAGTIYEYTDLELYRVIVLSDHAAMADRMLRQFFRPADGGGRRVVG